MGLAGIILFVGYEKRVATVPMIHFDLLRNYNIIYALFAAFFHTILFLGLVYVLPLYFEAVQRFEPLHAALAMIPFGATVAPFSAIAGIVISKLGSINWVIRVGYTITLSGTGLLALLNTETKIWHWILMLAWTGAGLGLLYNALLLLAQASIDERRAAFAVTVLNFFRHLGQAVGVAIVGVIFQNQMRDILLRDQQLAPFAEDFSSDAAALVKELTEMEEGSFKTSIIEAYAGSLRVIWIVMCAFCVLPLLGSFFLKPVIMDRHHETAQGLKHTRTKKGESENEVGNDRNLAPAAGNGQLGNQIVISAARRSDAFEEG